MDGFRARVLNGRLVLNEPTDLPEGTELDLTVADPGDDLSDQERAELHPALARAWAQAKAGEGSPAEELISKLRARR